MARATDVREPDSPKTVKRITLGDVLFVTGMVALSVSGFALNLFAGLLSTGATLVFCGIGAGLVERAQRVNGDSRRTTKHSGKS